MTNPNNARPLATMDLSVCAGCGGDATRWAETKDRVALGCCASEACGTLIESMVTDSSKARGER